MTVSGVLRWPAVFRVVRDHSLQDRVYASTDTMKQLHFTAKSCFSGGMFKPYGKKTEHYQNST